MKSNRSILRFLLAALLSVLLVCAASLAEEASFPVFPWEHDGHSHWQLDADGTVMNLEAHQMNALRCCSICKGEILDWGDGTIDVTDYDEYGNVLRYCSYAEDGLLTYESIHIYTYHESGIPLKDTEYLNGTLYGESAYTVSEELEQIPVSQIFYNDDATISVNEYDVHGNCVRAYISDADGHVLFETVSEFAPLDFGWFYECKTTSRFDTGETFYRETNEYGDTVRSVNTEADGTVWSDIVYEYEYKHGVKVWYRQYDSGVLAMEGLYNREGTLTQETEYMEDGSRSVWDYNDEGDLLTVTEYDAAGSIVSITDKADEE